MAKISRKIIKKALILLDRLVPVYLLIVILNVNLPHVQAAEATSLNVQLPLETGKIEVLRSLGQDPSGFPLDVTGQIREPRYKLKVWVTAYNSHPSQTDSTPCLTASGLDVCQRSLEGAEDIVATNLMYLPFGTKIRMPELFGDKVFIVHDRMNARYSRTVDVWMAEYAMAKQFGKQWTEIEIF